MVYILGDAVTRDELKIDSVGGLRVRLLLNKNVMPYVRKGTCGHLLKKTNAKKRQKNG